MSLPVVFIRFIGVAEVAGALGLLLPDSSSTSGILADNGCGWQPFVVDACRAGHERALPLPRQFSNR